jgi:hypothetical protein
MNPQPGTEQSKPKGEQPAEKIAPQSTVGSKASDRTPNGDASRGIDTGAIEPGHTDKNGAAAG